MVDGAIEATARVSRNPALERSSRLEAADTLLGLAPEGMMAAIRSGLRFAQLSHAIQAVLVRSALFGLLASAVWALIQHHRADQDAELGGRTGPRHLSGRAFLWACA